MSKKNYSVSEFKAKSLGILERVARKRETITVTKRGVAIAQVIPIPQPEMKPVPGRLKDTLMFEGDLIAPLGAKLWKASE